MHRKTASAGTPQRMPWTKAVAPGRISGAIPKASSASGIALRNRNMARPSASASHSACRNSGPIWSRRPAPSSCDTEAGTAISVPIGTSNGSQNSAVPTDTAASVAVPWWPAMTASTRPISPVETWPATSGAASRALLRSSSRKRGVGDSDMTAPEAGDAGMGRRMGWHLNCAHRRAYRHAHSLRLAGC